MAGAVHQPAGRYSMRYAWPSARWGSLPLEGGIEAAYRADIDAAEDPAAKLDEIEARLQLLRSPFRTAETFWVEEIIDPRETRRLLCDFAAYAEKSAGCRDTRARPPPLGEVEVPGAPFARLVAARPRCQSSQPPTTIAPPQTRKPRSH